MGFGSGGGGFTPSPNNVPGSTQTGTDIDTDVHQFTGSVDITGSLTLNGSSVTGGGGGGGGAVSTYTNAGNDRVLTSVNSNTINGEASLTFDGTSLTSPQVTASVSMKTAALEISSSAEGALFRIDHETQSGPEPILFVTGSGLVGIGTDSPLSSTPGDDTNRLHIVGNNGAEQGQAPVLNTQLVLENDSHAGIQFMFPSGQSGQITWGIPGAARKAVFYYSSNNNRYEFNGASFGGKRIMTMLANGDSVNIGSSSSGHMITNKASLHISSSEAGADKGGPVLLRVDHGDQPGAAPSLFVTGSGRVGIGTASPSAPLDVLNTSTQARFSYDADSFATLTVADGGDTTLSSSEGGNITLDADDIFLKSNGGQVKIERPGGSTRLQFDVSTSTSLIDSPNNTDIAFRLGTGLKELARLDQSENALLMSGTFNNPGGDAGINFRDTANSIHSPGSNRLALTSPTLEITGSTKMSGALRIDTADTTDNPAIFVDGSTSLVGIGCADPEARLEVREDLDNEDVFIQVRGDGSSSGYAGFRAKRNIGNAEFKLKNDGTTPRVEIATERVSSFPRPNVELHPGGEAVLKALYQAGLEITGSTKISGTFGSTAIETLTAAGTISATTGLTIIDASSSLAVNNTLNFTIANGTFVGQEKKIRAMIKSGSTGPLSTGIAIGGANIDSAGDVPVGQIVLSGNLPDNGPLFHRAGCSLIWGGTKWLPVGNFNFNINNTGRSFI